ncbi:MAG: PepSY-associated TM helix domain-containing protein [Sphingomonadales bacterium]
MSTAAKPQHRRAFWLRQLHTWHWVSAAICLIGMLLFAVTGITLNNASRIEASAKVTNASARLPGVLLEGLAPPVGDKGPLPAGVSGWIGQHMDVNVRGAEGEWSDGEVYVALPRPGGDAWLALDTVTGEINYERTDRGMVSYLNDLHKGRHTGSAWSWFLDVFSVACIVFTLTGLFLLQLHAGRRPATWPVVGAGFAIPLLLIILFIH